jgi:hypothetical protein
MDHGSDKHLEQRLERIEQHLQRLVADVAAVRRREQEQSHLPVTRQDVARLGQETTWDVSMLRQEMATKQNLLSLRWALASKQDLAVAVETLCKRLATFRFESHQEHQQLFRTVEEGPYGWSVTPGVADPPVSPGRERTAPLATSPEDEVLEIEDVSAVVASAPRPVSLLRAAAAGGER